MWHVSESVLFKTLIIGLFLMAASGCGQPSGNAPGAPPPSPTPSPVPVTSPESAVMKYGETVTTPGGWTISIDNSDPVENSMLANGWTVEVLGE